MEDEVRKAFAGQARACERLGSPFTALLCRLIGERIDRSTAIGRAVLDWPGPPASDALPLRLAGGLHALVRRGDLRDLAACYPPAQPDPEALWQALGATFREHSDALLPWLASAPQTNEVARAAVLWTGLLHVAQATDLPIALLELGSSGGLNLIPDSYAYDLGGRQSGDADSALHLAPGWEGKPPPDVPVEIAERRGVDLNPLDVALPAHRERLATYVWPDQHRRLERIETALAIAARRPPPIERGDAADWLEARLAEPRRACRVLVVQHSIFLLYLRDPDRERIAAAMDRAGRAATPDTPLAWLHYELDDLVPLGASLRLTLWNGSGGPPRETLLAHADPHAGRIMAVDDAAETAFGHR